MLGPYKLNEIVTGDARVLAEKIPNESVDLIFTDPVYQNIGDYEWLSKVAARVLKPEGHLLAWQAVKYIGPTIQALNQHLTYRWTLNLTRSNVSLAGTFANFFSHWTPCFWYTKGIEPKPMRRFRDSWDVPYRNNVNPNHQWHKPEEIIRQWLGDFSQVNAIIFDPFTGGGTVPAVCKMLSRQYLAFEIDSLVAEKARERVLLTQPPLFVEMPEQLGLEV